MITITDDAKKMIAEYVEQVDDCLGIRIGARQLAKHHFNYDIRLVTESDVSDADQVTELGSFNCYLDPDSAANLEGASIDWVNAADGGGFKIDNPQTVVTWDDPIANKVQQVIDEKVAPSLAGHGGWIELTKIEGDAAYIEFGGGCQGCGMSSVTLKDGIEAAILAEVPEIKQVLDGTDHSSGANPYYQGGG
ncbi:MAG: NifU family protein [Thermoanaerobaculales bacterium]|jgi:Fe/S biogenesis protein NfuA|nr:NifU family protein [Thermoanaerobaculales bacterium]